MIKQFLQRTLSLAAVAVFAANAIAAPSPIWPDSTVPVPVEASQPWLQTLRNIWHAELFNVGDSTIRLNQIVIALLVLILGTWLSRRFSIIVGHRFMRFDRIDRHGAAAIQKILFYILVSIIAMIALPIAGIPMTAFTVVGGALAIGVGFGAQNLFNNLISGLIIMTEKPIRLGDIVEVGENRGRVEDIGNRCTRIRRFDGVDVMVPNSYFLENPVVNWTLGDTDIRAAVTVGVAYGSPTRKIAELVQQAVQTQENVIKEKGISVLFNDFGDNALMFEVLFWTNISQPMDLRHLQSNVRYGIDELFREANITIAYPQRDVHLDSLKPVEVRIVGNAATTTPKNATA